MKKKILLIVGTRPNFIKITQFEKEFAKYPAEFEYRLIHTGQHFDKNMSDLFFNQFGLKKPDATLNVKGLDATQQIGKIITELGKYFQEWRPDLVMVVGDVNSTLAGAIAANKNGIRLAHLESGLRSGDRSMPEEINRILTDSITDVFFVTEQSGLENLQKELDRPADIHFVGNTMIDTLVAFDDAIQASTILEELRIEEKAYCLMTMHRPQNVDHEAQLNKLIDTIDSITSRINIVFPIHPRTEKNLRKFNLFKRLENNSEVRITGPMDYLAFQKLISRAAVVVTDSGGIQEETTFRGVPCLTLRPNTERPCTITEGTNELVEFEVNVLKKKIDQTQKGVIKKGKTPKYWDGKTTERIVELLRTKSN